jgi:hypothetical protein
LKPALDHLLRAMSPVVRKTMLTKCRPDCCVATCKILREVFAYYGYKARPFAVAVFIYNEAMQDLIARGVTFPEDLEKRVALFDEVGAWGVGIHPEARGEPGVGHLVLGVGGKLVDASLDQASRPERNINLPPLLSFDAPPGFFAERVKSQQIKGMVDGSLVIYKRVVNDTYRTSLNWREEHGGVPELYDEILTHVSINLEKMK